MSCECENKVEVTHYLWFNWQFHKIKNAYCLECKYEKDIIWLMAEYNEEMDKYTDFEDDRTRLRLNRLESEVRECICEE